MSEHRPIIDGLTPAQLDQLIAAASQRRDELLLNDFSNTLAAVIENRLDFLQEPVFTNPTTGKKAASVCSILVALDYDFRGHWGTLVKPVKTLAGTAAFERRDLPKAKPGWPTVCLDLEAVEETLPAIQPRKAAKVLKEFRTTHGLI